MIMMEPSLFQVKMADFKSVSLADQVFDKLENDIIVGIYPRGEVLTELKLVEQLGVSRTPIREALRRLEQERLIADSGKGSIVLGITDDDLLDIMNIRESVEGLAAYYAAVNIDDEGREALLHIVDLQDFYFSKGDLDRLRKVDDEFHDAICRLSGRTVIKDIAPDVRALLFWLKNRRPENWKDGREISIADPVRIEFKPEEKEL